MYGKKKIPAKFLTGFFQKNALEHKKAPRARQVGTGRKRERMIEAIRMFFL